MAELMSNKAKAKVLRQVANLIEDNLGYKVERCLGQGDWTDLVYKLDLVEDQNQVKLTKAYIKIDDIYRNSGTIWSNKPTGEVRIVITDDGYERDKFKKWSKASTLDFDKGVDHKPTAKFLDKVKELVEYQVAVQKRKDDLTAKRKSDFETLTEWTKRPGMPKGYRFVDRAVHGQFLVMDGNQGGGTDNFRIKVEVLSKERMERFGYNEPICATINGCMVGGATLDKALRMFKELHDLLKANNQ